MFGGRKTVDLALDVEEGMNAFDRLECDRRHRCGVLSTLALVAISASAKNLRRAWILSGVQIRSLTPNNQVLVIENRPLPDWVSDVAHIKEPSVRTLWAL